ncbi:hypothetical protein DSECCO2_529590 [anaerobic digester metagenome]|jgi:hypothetical protein
MGAESQFLVCSSDNQDIVVGFKVYVGSYGKRVPLAGEIHGICDLCEDGFFAADEFHLNTPSLLEYVVIIVIIAHILWITF